MQPDPIHIRVDHSAADALPVGASLELFFAAPAPQALLDPLGTMHAANGALAELLGVLPPEATSRPLHRFLTQQSHAAWFRHLDGLFKNPGPHEVVVDVRGPGRGERRRLRLVSTVVSTGGPVPWALCSAREVVVPEPVTPRQVHAERLSTLGVLAAGLAHEISNPLTYMRQNTEMAVADLEGLLERLQSGEPVDRAEVQGLATQALDAMRDLQEGQSCVEHLVGELRDLSRSEAVPEPVRMDRVVRRVIRVAGKHLRSRVVLDERLEAVPTIRANECRLFQVVLNLVLNAAQAMDGSAEPGRVGIAVYRTDTTVVVAVSDDGPGIAPAVRDRIFEPFFTTKPVGEGTGLGLSVTRSIVEELGGRIHVDTEVGEGTTFEVSLPLPRRAHRQAIV